ncbi:BBE domain-containing protein [Streptomyces sp. NPDC002232]|uniref:BBE domain-containing protein n=1 Tax=Streptomyces sp. NPDC002232 TaxID=3364640 RepID=UPI0036CEB35B
MGPAAPAAGGQLPAGVQPRPADRHGAAAHGERGVRGLIRAYGARTGAGWPRTGLVRRLVGRTGARALDATYLNFVGAEGEQRIVSSFGEENFRRLADVKAAYDPENVFRYNQNIPPAG